MKGYYAYLLGMLFVLLVPVLACGPASFSQQVTPTPTKTPRRIIVLEEVVTVTPTPLPTDTPTPLPTDTPVPLPTDTPVPLPTDTPVPLPTDTPIPPPPPPPTFTPAPPAPTQPPAPPPPTQPPASPLQVVVELPSGNDFSIGDQVRIIFIARDPGGVKEFTWGIFLQNQTPLKNGTKKCDGATECREEVKAEAPIAGTYILGADAVNMQGQTKRGIGELYVN